MTTRLNEYRSTLIEARHHQAGARKNFCGAVRWHDDRTARIAVQYGSDRIGKRGWMDHSAAGNRAALEEVTMVTAAELRGMGSDSGR